MNRHFVIKCDYPQNPTTKFRDCSPEPETIFLLRFAPDGVFEDLNAPLLLQVGAFA